jgi:transposase
MLDRPRELGGCRSAEIVFDKFHVLQHASAALDDVRRWEFFRASAVMAGVRPRQALVAARRCAD